MYVRNRRTKSKIRMFIVVGGRASVGLGPTQQQSESAATVVTAITTISKHRFVRLCMTDNIAMNGTHHYNNINNNKVNQVFEFNYPGAVDGNMIYSIINLDMNWMRDVDKGAT